MKLLRKIFIPFVPVYYLVSSLRNKLFDLNVIKSKTYNSAIICVGNLSVGGTGKTPMIEYLIRLLKNNQSIATLSRGYKRQTSGFLLANSETKVEEVGDEPFQFKNKFDDILVAVDEQRQNGIEQLLALKNPPDVILLDDGYQHRKVKAGLSILLTQYNKLYVNDMVLPTGDLRESKSGAKRADIVIVTKCPKDLGDLKKEEIKKSLKLNTNQKLFFSVISYDDTLYNLKKCIPIEDLASVHFTLITGIADSRPLIDHLKSKGFTFDHLNFKDHHKFNKNDIDKFRNQELLVTTEKDFMRLKNKIEPLNLYYLPIKTELLNGADFNKMIKQFVLSFSR